MPASEIIATEAAHDPGCVHQFLVAEDFLQDALAADNILSSSLLDGSAASSFL